jgi:hypothetical protein
VSDDTERTVGRGGAEPSRRDTPVESTLTVAEQTLVALEAIHQKQDQYLKRLDLLAGDVESLHEEHEDTATASASDERLTQVERAVKWATPWRNLAALVAFFILTGGTMIVALRGSFKEAVVETVKEAHGGDEPTVEPSVKAFTLLEKDVGSMKGGMDCLVAAKKREHAVKALEVELELHQQQHEERVQEWTARKAARRSVGEKPKKTDGHLALEAKLKRLTAAVDKQCIEETP